MTEIRKLGCRVKQVTIEHDISDEKLAEILGTSVINVKKLYFGNYMISTKQAQSLCEFTGMGIKELLDTSHIDETTYCRCLVDCDVNNTDFVDAILDIMSEYIRVREAVEFRKVDRK